MDLEIYKDIPGYKGILKAVLKSQIQMLVEQLANQTGEESVVLSASVTDGTLSHLGTESGKDFLRGHDEIKKQFLGFCLKRQQSGKRKPEESYSSSHKRFAVSTSSYVSSEDDVPATVTEVVLGPISSPATVSERLPARKAPLRRRGPYHPRGTIEPFSKLTSHFKLSSLAKDTHRKDPFERGDTVSSYDDSAKFEGAEKFDNSVSVSASSESYSPSQTGYITEVDRIPVPVSLEKRADNDGGDDSGGVGGMDSGGVGGVDFSPEEGAVRVKVEYEEESEQQTDDDGGSAVKSKEDQMYMSRLGPETLPSQLCGAEDGGYAENESQSYDYVLNQGKELESSLSSWKQESASSIVSVPFTSKRKQLWPAKFRKNEEPGGGEANGSDMNDSGNDYADYSDMTETASAQETGINSYCKDDGDSSAWMYENANTLSPSSSHSNHASSADAAMGYMSDGFNTGMQRKFGKSAAKVVEKNGVLSTQVKDGAFVSRGEGRYEKLIKCELCGKVCRTSNMARHKKRYCLALPGTTGGNVSGVKSDGDRYGNTGYSYTYTTPTSYS